MSEKTLAEMEKEYDQIAADAGVTEAQERLENDNYLTYDERQNQDETGFIWQG